MKKSFFKAATVKVYTTALATSLIFLTSFSPASAADKSAKTSDAKITYVGSNDNHLTFNVEYTNEDETPFLLILTDEMGQILHQKKYTNKTFKKDIVLTMVGEVGKVNFTIKSGKNTVTEQFLIDTKVNMVEELIVTKI